MHLVTFQMLYIQMWHLFNNLSWKIEWTLRLWSSVFFILVNIFDTSSPFLFQNDLWIFINFPIIFASAGKLKLMFLILCLKLSKKCQCDPKRIKETENTMYYIFYLSVSSSFSNYNNELFIVSIFHRPYPDVFLLNRL